LSFRDGPCYLNSNPACLESFLPIWRGPTVVTNRPWPGSRTLLEYSGNRLNITAEFGSVVRPMTHEERRQYSRKTPNPLPHISLPDDNGGIVLDVSEQGLRFRATAPVEQSGPIHFCFTVNSNLVAGIGELVWIDQAKKMGGLRFTQLPYDALVQIRKWPRNANLRPGISKDLTLHIPAPEQFPASAVSRRGARAAFASKLASGVNRLLPGSFRSNAQKNWLPAVRNTLMKLHSLSPEGHFQKQNRWLLRTTYALVLGIVFSTLVYVRHRDAGELLIRMGTRLSGEVNAPAPAPAVASEGPRVENESASQSKGDAPVAQALPQPVSADVGITAMEIPAGTPAPQAQQTVVRLAKPEAPRKELVLQVAALTQEVDARELTNRLRQRNFEAFVGTLPVDSYYRVMVGPYADEASARIVLGKLKKAGFNSFIRRESGAERLGS
jgi:SPOR domain/PilZ domain